MKKNLHPKLHLITVTNADGEVFTVLSAKPGNLTINSSRSMHTAWTGQKTVVRGNPKADKLKQFF